MIKIIISIYKLNFLIIYVKIDSINILILLNLILFCCRINIYSNFHICEDSVIFFKFIFLKSSKIGIEYIDEMIIKAYCF